MALSLDDRLLGEKVHNYCSSSSGSEDNESDADSTDNRRPGGKSRKSLKVSKAEEAATAGEIPRQWRGSAANTGPKGVVADWRRYKQLEAESRACQEAERRALASRLALTCRSQAEDEQAAALDAELAAAMAELDQEDEAFLAEYRHKRLEEVRLALMQRKLFGSVADLSAGDFVQAVDSEPTDVKVVVLIHSGAGQQGHDGGCEAAVSAGLGWLAGRYPTVKFCRIAAKEARVSRRFVERGLPALVVYKAGDVTDSFVGLDRQLGVDCPAEELEQFLTEYGVLSEALLSEGRTVSQLASSSAQPMESSSSSSGKFRGPSTHANGGASSDSDGGD